MNKTIAEALPLVAGISEGVSAITDVETVVCPPFVALQAVSTALAGSNVGVGAQNVYF